jgi:hypothetical protein
LLQREGGNMKDIAEILNTLNDSDLALQERILLILSRMKLSKHIMS